MSKIAGSIRTQHKCNICGKWSVWNERWQWFGSILDEEEGLITKTCSKRCRRAFDADPKGYHPFAKHSRNPSKSPKITSETPLRK